jgi:hypothetical protein
MAPLTVALLSTISSNHRRCNVAAALANFAASDTTASIEGLSAFGLAAGYCRH